jgi:hypothetical protein
VLAQAFGSAVERARLAVLTAATGTPSVTAYGGIGRKSNDEVLPSSAEENAMAAGRGWGGASRMGSNHPLKACSSLHSLLIQGGEFTDN